jgi:hypothetical protein
LDANVKIDILKNEMVFQVCTEIGLCNNIIVAPTKSDQECTLCEMLISKLDATIEDKGNEEELKKYFEQICSYMPSSVAPSCKKYVEEYGDAVIDLIAQGLDPEQASNKYICECRCTKEWSGHSGLYRAGPV